MLKSIKLVEHVIKLAKRKFFKVKVNIKLIAAYISFWDDPSSEF